MAIGGGTFFSLCEFVRSGIFCLANGILENPSFGSGKIYICFYQGGKVCGALVRSPTTCKYRILSRLGRSRRYAALDDTPQILLHKFEKIRPKKSMTWFL